MGYEVFVYLFCVAFLTLCASRSPRLIVVHARSQTRVRDRACVSAGRRRDLSTWD